MKLRLALLMSVLGGLQLAPATGETPQPPAVEAPPAAKAELSEKLDDLVDRAIGAQLLRPPGSQLDAPATAGVTSSAAAVEVQRRTCPGKDLLDFSSVSGIATLSDLEGQSAAGNASLPQQLEMAKAQIALALYSEAAVTLREVPPDQAEPLLQLARLLAGRWAADTEYLAWLSSCDDDGRVWLAAALLAEGRAEGAAILSEQIDAFRALPLSLRADLALLAIPALVEIGENVLAGKLMAGFSAEEIEPSSRLRFCKALLNVHTGDAAAAAIIRRALWKPEFQIDALASLARQKTVLSPVERDVLAEDITRLAASEGQPRKAAVVVKFALDEMEAGAGYDLVLDMAKLPAFGADLIRGELRKHLESRLTRDLQNEDPLTKLVALDAVLKARSVFSGGTEGEGILQLARAEAAALGHIALAERLAVAPENAMAVPEQKASAAFAAKDDDTLHALAASQSASPRVIVLAAMRAIQTGDTARLKIYERSLMLNHDAVLTLIEEDALGAKWIVSEDVYAVARTFDDAARKSRVDRVVAIKSAAQKPPGSAPRAEVADVNAALAKTGLALGNMSRETQ